MLQTKKKYLFVNSEYLFVNSDTQYVNCPLAGWTIKSQLCKKMHKID